MGYYSNISGEIDFEPPATWTEIRASGAREEWFKFEVKSEEFDTDEGTLTRRSARKIVVIYHDDGKAYHVEEELAILIAALPGREFSGEFRIEGEDNNDISRLFVDADGNVVRWRAQLLWPDGSTEKGRE